MGVYDFGARFYQDAIARFYQPDWSATVEPVPYAKLDNPQSLNLYTYVLNNPLTLRDPDGHEDAAPDPTQVAEKHKERDPVTGRVAHPSLLLARVGIVLLVRRKHKRSRQPGNHI